MDYSWIIVRIKSHKTSQNFDQNNIIVIWLQYVNKKQTKAIKTIRYELQQQTITLVRVLASYMPIISHKLIIGLWPLADPPELDYTIYISNCEVTYY